MKIYWKLFFTATILNITFEVCTAVTFYQANYLRVRLPSTTATEHQRRDPTQRPLRPQAPNYRPHASLPLSSLDFIVKKPIQQRYSPAQLHPPPRPATSKLKTLTSWVSKEYEYPRERERDSLAPIFEVFCRLRRAHECSARWNFHSPWLYHCLSKLETSFT